MGFGLEGGCRAREWLKVGWVDGGISPTVVGKCFLRRGS